jgi:hypothetical protein
LRRQPNLFPAAGGEFDHSRGARLLSTSESPAEYRLRLGDIESSAFEIGDDADAQLPGELSSSCASNVVVTTRTSLPSVIHSTDEQLMDRCRREHILDAHGGWHDAGDLLKLSAHVGNATAQMLLAYQLQTLRRASLPIISTDLGQPGANGIADVLDEARWGLDWMISCIRRLISFITRWPTIAIIKGSGCRRTKPSIMVGLRQLSSCLFC